MFLKSKFDENLPVAYTCYRKAPKILSDQKALCRMFNNFSEEPNFDKSLKITSVVEKSQTFTVNTLILT